MIGFQREINLISSLFTEGDKIVFFSVLLRKRIYIENQKLAKIVCLFFNESYYKQLLLIAIL